MVSIEEYRIDPCGTSSLPYWKTNAVAIPDNMTIVHHRDFVAEEHRDSTDAPYFRLVHRLEDIPAPKLPSGYCLSSIELPDYAAHINSCYRDIGVSLEELTSYTTRKVYDPSLWIAVTENATGAVIATGIGELDAECGEGVLEWIQVSADHRRARLGSYLVCELLRRMAKKASFVTVSGKRNDPSEPEKLYRKCGFTGDDIWHILRKK